MSSLLEISIAYWGVVDAAAFRKAVDTLGGVEVTVEARLVYQDRARNLFIDIPAGRQTLDGAKALDFLRYENGDEGARLKREHDLVRAGVEGGRLRSLGRQAVEEIWAGAQTNLSRWEAFDLARAAADLTPERLTVAVAPAVARPGGGEDRVPDVVRLRKLVQSIARGQAFLTRDEVRVLVLNGTGTRLLATKTGGWLAGLGFQVVGTGEADRSNYPRTHLVVRDGAREKGRALLEILPPPVQATVQVQTDREFDLARVGGWPQDTDVILILGAGFDVRL